MCLVQDLPLDETLAAVKAAALGPWSIDDFFPRMNFSWTHG